MTAPAGRFADLVPRVASGAMLGAAGGGAVFAGGVWFSALIVLCVGLMLWELLRMTAPMLSPVRLAVLAAAGAAGLPLALAAVPALLFPVAVLPVLVALVLPPTARGWFAALGAALVLAGAELVELRAERGALWVLWLVLVVVASDVAGYFVGKAVGGPRILPRISPKKTWSGTVAGWAGAAAVGAALAGPTGLGLLLVPLSVAVAMAGQAGDMVESAVKRRSGVKDASSLIPGHGGVLDRFDAMMGAALAVFVLDQVGLFPGVTAGG